jgi:signal transduction histidine kinase
VLFHPDAANIGADFVDRPYVQNVIAGESGGTLWRARTGEEVVLGYAPVANTDWGLIVREPWDTVVGPAQTYGALMALATLAAVAVAAYLLLQGVRRIAVPIRLLVEQTRRLAAGTNVEPVAVSGVEEIDTLESAFGQMAVQITSYRAGLRRYVEAITQSQEDERRRIARELHDDTVQNLIWVNRRLELFQASEKDPNRRAQLAELQRLMADSVQGVRQISRDLRPPVLEDLGLVPALQTLIDAAHQGQGAIPHATLKVRGQAEKLSAEQELALYRLTQEALANVRRHAQATGVCVSLAFEPTAVQLDILDDGQGFEVPPLLTDLAQRDSFGLMGIQERVWALGGSMVIQSSPGQGACIHVSLPRQPALDGIQTFVVR